MRARAALLCCGAAALVAVDAGKTQTLVVPGSPLSALTPPWIYSGFERFPSFYFGANEDGPQSGAELAFIAKFSLAGWGWQQGYAHSGRAHGEALGQAAASALRAVAPPCPPPQNATANCTTPDATFVYRQSESLFTFFDLMRDVTQNATLDYAATLRDPVSKAACGGGGLLGFSNDTFQAYWSGVVGGEVAGEGNVSAVFLDGFDKLYSPGALAAEGCPGFTEEATAAELLQKVQAEADQLRVLGQGSRAAILSTYNFFSSNSSLAEEEEAEAAAAPPPAAGGSPQRGYGSISGITEDDYASAFAGLPYLRFYEVWMGHGTAQDTAMLLNAMRETELGIPFVARTDVGSLRTLEYPAAAFLIAQGPWCYWGASSGWTDGDWTWHGEYEWGLGRPLGPANRTSATTWARAFEKGTATVDVGTARGSIAPNR